MAFDTQAASGPNYFALIYGIAGFLLVVTFLWINRTASKAHLDEVHALVPKLLRQALGRAGSVRSHSADARVQDGLTDVAYQETTKSGMVLFASIDEEPDGRYLMLVSGTIRRRPRRFATQSMLMALMCCTELVKDAGIDGEVPTNLWEPSFGVHTVGMRFTPAQYALLRSHIEK